MSPTTRRRAGGLIEDEDADPLSAALAGLNVPVPDPSTMTTRQLQREIFGLRELMETKLVNAGASNDGNRGIIETRLDGMDKAIKLLQDTADKFPDRIDEKITALRAVHEQKFTAVTESTTEKFGSIQTQFKERDVRTEQAAGAVKIAVDAALQAQKEAVGEQNKSSSTAISKSELATMKQIDQLSILIQTMTKAFDDKIGDVKDRLTRLEGKGEGVEKQVTTQNSSTATIIAVVGMLVGLAGVVVAVLVAFGKG